MRAVLSICRDYGQPPSWWWGLDAEDQALLLADLKDRDRRNRRLLSELEARRRGR